MSLTCREEAELSASPPPQGGAPDPHRLLYLQLLVQQQPQHQRSDPQHLAR